MEQFFNPQSIAIIGASDKQESIGNTLLENLIQGGFAGTILPVNPNLEEIHGIKTFPTIIDAHPLPTWPSSRCPSPRPRTSSVNAFGPAPRALSS